MTLDILTKSITNLLSRVRQAKWPTKTRSENTPAEWKPESKSTTICHPHFSLCISLFQCISLSLIPVSYVPLMFHFSTIPVHRAKMTTDMGQKEQDLEVFLSRGDCRALVARRVLTHVLWACLVGWLPNLLRKDLASKS